jgi:hypothetical protein
MLGENVALVQCFIGTLPDLMEQGGFCQAGAVVCGRGREGAVFQPVRPGRTGGGGGHLDYGKGS